MFDDAWADAAFALDGTFAESVLITPMKNGSDNQYFVKSDATRPSRVVQGVYDSKTQLVRDLGRQAAIRAQTDRLDDRVTIDFSLAAIGGPTEWPVVGDTLALIDREESPVFTIVAPDVSGHGRIGFKCTRLIK